MLLQAMLHIAHEVKFLAGMFRSLHVSLVSDVDSVLMGVASEYLRSVFDSGKVRGHS